MSAALADRIERLHTELVDGISAGRMGAWRSQESIDRQNEALASWRAMLADLRARDAPRPKATEVPADIPTSCVVRVVGVSVRPDDPPMIHVSDIRDYAVITNGPTTVTGEIQFMATVADAEALTALARGARGEPIGLVSLRRDR